MITPIGEFFTIYHNYGGSDLVIGCDSSGRTTQQLGPINNVGLVENIKRAGNYCNLDIVSVSAGEDVAIGEQVPNWNKYEILS